MKIKNRKKLIGDTLYLGTKAAECKLSEINVVVLENKKQVVTMNFLLLLTVLNNDADEICMPNENGDAQWYNLTNIDSVQLAE